MVVVRSNSNSNSSSSSLVEEEEEEETEEGGEGRSSDSNSQEDPRSTSPIHFSKPSIVRAKEFEYLVWRKYFDPEEERYVRLRWGHVIYSPGPPAAVGS